MKRILVIDVGGTNVKVHVTGEEETVKIPSGHYLGPARMAREVLAVASERGWKFDAATIGVPAPVTEGQLALEPANLGRGWRRFDFARALGKPVRLVNDAAMQALGSYGGKGTMLFLGLGTGLGAALVCHGALVPLELARLPYLRGELEDYVGERALVRMGKPRWRESVEAVVTALAAAFVVDEVVLGGGNSRKLKRLPARARLGSNELAMVGGERLWAEPGAKASPRGEGRVPPRRKGVVRRAPAVPF